MIILTPEIDRLNGAAVLRSVRRDEEALLQVLADRVHCDGVSGRWVGAG